MISLNSIFLSSTEQSTLRLSNQIMPMQTDALSFMNFLKAYADHNKDSQIAFTLSPEVSQSVLNDTNGSIENKLIINPGATENKPDLFQKAELVSNSINQIIKGITTAEISSLENNSLSQAQKNYQIITSEPLYININQLKEVIGFFTSPEIFAAEKINTEEIGLNPPIIQKLAIEGIIKELILSDKALIIPLQGNDIVVEISEKQNEIVNNNDNILSLLVNNKEEMLFADFTKDEKNNLLSIPVVKENVSLEKNESLLMSIQKAATGDELFKVSLILNTNKIVNKEIPAEKDNLLNETTSKRVNNSSSSSGYLTPLKENNLSAVQLTETDNENITKLTGSNNLDFLNNQMIKKEIISPALSGENNNPQIKNINITLSKAESENTLINNNVSNYVDEAVVDDKKIVKEKSVEINSALQKEVKTEEEVATNIIKVKKHYQHQPAVLLNHQSPKENNSSLAGNNEIIPKENSGSQNNLFNAETLQLKDEKVNLLGITTSVKDEKAVTGTNQVFVKKAGLEEFITEYKPKQLSFIISSKQVNSPDKPESIIKNQPVNTPNPNSVTSNVVESLQYPKKIIDINRDAAQINLNKKPVAIEKESIQPIIIKTGINDSFLVSETKKATEQPEQVNLKSTIKTHQVHQNEKPEVKIPPHTLQYPEKTIDNNKNVVQINLSKKPVAIEKESIQPIIIKTGINDSFLVSETKKVTEQPEQVNLKSTIKTHQVHQNEKPEVKIPVPTISIEKEGKKIVLHLNINEKPIQVEVKSSPLNKETQFNEKISYQLKTTIEEFVNKEENNRTPDIQASIRQDSVKTERQKFELNNEIPVKEQMKNPGNDLSRFIRSTQEEIRTTLNVQPDKKNEEYILQTNNKEELKKLIYTQGKTDSSFFINENARESVKYISSFIQRPELRREIEQYQSIPAKENIFRNAVSYITAKNVYDEIKIPLNDVNLNKISEEIKEAKTETSINLNTDPVKKHEEPIKNVITETPQTVQQKQVQQVEKKEVEQTITSNESGNQKSTIKDSVEWINDGIRSGSTSPNDKVEAAAKPVMKEFTRHVKAAEIIKEIAQFIQRKEDSTLILRVTPVELGALKISIKEMNQLVRADIEVETEHVKNLVETNISQLRETLQLNGVQLSSLTISLNSSEQKNQKSAYLKKKQQTERDTKEINEKSESIQKRMGYNTYDYVV